ncbi:JAB domain-containing protein [Sphingobium sp. TomMM35A]
MVRGDRSGRSQHLEAMAATESIRFLLLDDQWRPLGRVDGGRDWRHVLQELLLQGSHWLIVEQVRPNEGSPHPRRDDIRLARSIARRLRPLEVTLADHVIHGGREQFSFRAAGLL